MKKEVHKHTGNMDDKKSSGGVKKEPDENKAQKDVNAMKAKKESKKSISRWDTDGGMDLCQ